MADGYSARKRWEGVERCEGSRAKPSASWDAFHTPGIYAEGWWDRLGGLNTTSFYPSEVFGDFSFGFDVLSRWGFGLGLDTGLIGRPGTFPMCARLYFLAVLSGLAASGETFAVW